MTYELSDEEYEHARSLEGIERYRYAIDRIRRSGQLWLLGDDEWIATFRNPEGIQLVYEWPHERFAREHSTGEWSGLEPFCMSLGAFLKSALPYLLEREMQLGVFFVSPGKAVFVWPDDFDAHLRNGVPC